MKFNWDKIRGLIKGDKTIWFIIVALSLFSLVIVYSATGKLAFKEADGNTFAYAFKHLGKMGLGFIFIILMVNFCPVKYYSKFANILLVITIGLLYFATAQHFLFHTATNRSVNLGFMTFQTAEIAKICLLIFVSKILATHRKGEFVSRLGFWKVLIASGIVLLPIALGDSSSALILAGSVFAVMIISRVEFKVLFSTAVVVIGLLILGIAFSSILPERFGRIHTVRARIMDFWSGDAEEIQGTTQAQYSQLAIYEGGKTPVGKGVGNNDVSNFIEAAYSDFIFAIIVEETGIVGAILILFAYLIILFRGGSIAIRSERSFSAFLVTGIVLMYTIQAFMNMMVATGLFPVTGQPLPFLSYGGTSMVFTLLAFGIVLSISDQTKIKPKSELAAGENELQLEEEEED
ncbi:MAG: FtsW/RodA/SpoVE family cell cycle protein [Mangrovibacterium sp.]